MIQQKCNQKISNPTLDKYIFSNNSDIVRIPIKIIIPENKL